MTVLLVDAGNSSIKWCLLKDNQLDEQQRCTYQNQTPQQCIEKIVNSNQSELDSVFIVSVLGADFIEEVQNFCANLNLKLIHVTAEKELAGVLNAYDEPKKLGADRFVAMVAVQHQNNDFGNKKACIIVDSGTATTIDAIDENGQYLGGLILPGIELCTSSLLSNTSQLPLWGKTRSGTQKHFKLELFSKNTSQAIQSASVLGLAGAIDSICTRMENSINNSAKVSKVLCGGGAKILHPYLESTYQLNQELIMQGLKIIAERHNKSNNT